MNKGFTPYNSESPGLNTWDEGNFKYDKEKSGPSGRGYTGFTVIEFIIVISIALLIVALAVPLYGNLQVSAQLDENTSQLIQTLRTGQQRSISRLNNASHGVYFQPDRYILYQGSSYTLRENAYDREIVLDRALELSFSLTGLGLEGDVNFSKGLGIPTKTGTVTLTHRVSGVSSISINRFGMIEQE